MPSFRDSRQLAQAASFEEELTPYLDNAWRTFSQEFDDEGSAEEAPAEPASDGENSDDNSASSASAVTLTLRNVPKMSIAILVVGTRGDVQPFLKLGQRLQEDGHRVRLATHNQYEEYVRQGGLEFYPLGGDPKKLSEFMCKTGGRLMPNVLSREAWEESWSRMAMLKEMMFATWPAVSEPDPGIEDPPNFRADAIIANPVAYGHVHVAEKLDVPVHLMFPQPWTPTGDIPHPLSILGNGCTRRAFRPQGLDAGIRRTQNVATYFGIDKFLYTGMRHMTNEFRESLGLEKIRVGEEGAHILHTHQVPFAYQWSPLLIPRPDDYGPHIEVTGTIFNDGGSDYQPPQELTDWLQKCRDEHNPPVFVGFGSMIISEPEELAKVVVQAACESDTRVLLQSSWSTFALDDNSNGNSKAKDLVYQLGNCPHDWLFKHVGAVVHHGGAGTAAAGLAAGIPAMICPFFGDQHIWAQAFLRVGVSVEPVPIDHLTPEVLADAFRTLRGQGAKGAKIVERARLLGQRLASEDGITGAVDAFYRHLPRDGLVCDVSLLLGTQRGCRLACWYSARLGLKLCSEAYAALHRAIDQDLLEQCDFQQYRYSVNWDFANPRSLMDGMKQALMSAASSYAKAGKGLIVAPLKGGYEGGRDKGLMGAVQGSVEGAGRGVSSILRHVSRGTKSLWRRPLMGLRNGYLDSKFRGRPVISEAGDFTVACPSNDVDEQQYQELLEAYKAAQALQQAWVQCLPQASGTAREEMYLPVHDIVKVLRELQYSVEVITSVMSELGVDAQASTPRDPEERNPNSELRHGNHLLPPVNTVTGSRSPSPSPRGAARAHASFLGDYTKSFVRRIFLNSDSSAERQIGFEELASLLQPHGVPPAVKGLTAKDVFGDALKRQPAADS